MRRKKRRGICHRKAINPGLIKKVTSGGIVVHLAPSKKPGKSKLEERRAARRERKRERRRTIP